MIITWQQLRGGKHRRSLSQTAYQRRAAGTTVQPEHNGISSRIILGFNKPVKLCTVRSFKRQSSDQRTRFRPWAAFTVRYPAYCLKLIGTFRPGRFLICNESEITHCRKLYKCIVITATHSPGPDYSEPRIRECIRGTRERSPMISSAVALEAQYRVSAQWWSALKKKSLRQNTQRKTLNCHVLRLSQNLLVHWL